MSFLARCTQSWVGSFVGVLARAGDRILPPSWRLMAVELGGRGDYGVVWAWPRVPRGRGVGGEAMDAVGRVRSAGRWSRGGVGGHFEKSRTRRGFLADGAWSRRQRARAPDDADGEASQPGHVLRAVPVRMRLRSSSKLQSRMWCIASMLQCPRLRERRRWGMRPGGEAGDAVDGFDAPLGGLDLDGVASNGEDLSDTGKSR